MQLVDVTEDLRKAVERAEVSNGMALVFSPHTTCAVVINESESGFVADFDLLSRVPGLLVLHDLVLHHARAAQFLEAKEVRDWRTNPGSVEARERAQGVLDAWRAELEYSYPRAGARLFAAHLGTVGDLLPYAYPLFRIPVEASRFTAVHNRFMADAIRDELPEAPVAVVPMPASRVPVDAAGVRALRARLGRLRSIGDGRYAIELAPADRPEALVAELRAHGATLVSVLPLGTTLEDVFVQSVREGSS